MAGKAPREPLSRERVLAAAVALADAEGLQAVTMRRLAANLGVEAMSLYHHLTGKDALLDGVAETVIDEVWSAVRDQDAARAEDGGQDAARAEDGDWRGRLRRRFLAARAVMLRHPWAPGLLTTRRTIPPGVYAYYEEILGTLVAAGFSYRIAHRALHAFGSMPLGFVQELFSPGPGGDGLDVEAAEAELAALTQAMPHLAAMVAAELHDAADPTLGWCDSQVEFEFTLDLLLDGLERLRG